MDLTPYEGKKVRLTLVYEGKLEKRGTWSRVSHSVTGKNDDTLYVNPDHVTDVKLAEPEWWPPLPGDVLHFSSDPAALVYTVTMDGTTLVPNKTEPVTLFAISEMASGKSWVHDSDQWTLLHKGASRLAKEGK